MASLPTVRLEYLTEDQVRAYVIADNHLAEKAGWDNSILAIELQHLLTLDANFEITVTGFEIPEIDSILLEGQISVAEDDESAVDVARPAVNFLGQPRQRPITTCRVAGSADPPPRSLKYQRRPPMHYCRVEIRLTARSQAPQKPNFSGGRQRLTIVGIRIEDEAHLCCSGGPSPQ